ncbi:hypothetical protein PEC18_08905 [Paucibacter sp. O1-1]|nr:hypothetical protein [Paucibacter sp. O1-1]MDA3825980.1 hypothetical protein [Paucibacter sp. O1-1]
MIFPKRWVLVCWPLKVKSKWSNCFKGNWPGAKIIIVRIHGRLSSIPGFRETSRSCSKKAAALDSRQRNQGELNPEFAAVSTVSPAILQENTGLLTRAGGYHNFLSLLYFLSDHLLLTGFGAESPLNLPEHGIYHPDLPENADMSDWLKYA